MQSELARLQSSHVKAGCKTTPTADPSRSMWTGPKSSYICSLTTWHKMSIKVLERADLYKMCSFENVCAIWTKSFPILKFLVYWIENRKILEKGIYIKKHYIVIYILNVCTKTKFLFLLSLFIDHVTCI